MVRANISPLAFYDSIDKQNEKKDYAFGEKYPLFTPDKQVLPFQFIRDSQGSESISSVSLVDKITGTSTDITSEMVSTGLTVELYTSLGFDIIKYVGREDMAITTPQGQYYLVIDDGFDMYYSEVFIIVNDVSQYLKLEYHDTENLAYNTGAISFTNNFRFNIYLPTQLSAPEYPFEEEVIERDGYSFPEKQVSEKKYKFNFLAAEYLLDAMRIIRMMDYITIVNKGDTYNAETFLISPSWEEGHYLASVDAEFECDTVIKKIGKTFSASPEDPTVVAENVLLTYSGEILTTKDNNSLLYIEP